MSFFKKAVWLIALVPMVLGFFGCEMPEEQEEIEVKGSWVLATTGDWASTETWTITDENITYTGDYGFGESTIYVADIVSFDNEGFNSDDATITSTATETGNAGYAVIKFTEVNNAGTGEIGKYNIFRWDIAEDGTAALGQGFKAVDGTVYPNVVNDVAGSEDDAISDINNTNGYFTYASSGAVLQ